MQLSEIHEALGQAGYLTNARIDMALFIAMTRKKPLLIEGAPGVGKTAVAKAAAQALDADFLRAQMYEGLTKESLMYDYNYQKQLLTIEMIRPALEEQLKGATVADAIRMADGEISNFYGKEYLIERPVLKSIVNPRKTVLLIDEIDKAPEEIEYMLFEFLEDYSISIPEYGPIACDPDNPPLVILTSNGYRDLSMPLKRRCAYLYIPNKTQTEYVEILKKKAGIDDGLAESIAYCLCTAQKTPLKQAPSVAEGIEWAQFLNSSPERTREFVLSSLSLLVKDSRDESRIRDIVKGQEGLWNS